MAFRAVLRGAAQASGASDAPADLCAGAVIAWFGKGDVDSAAPVLLTVMEAANHDSWYEANSLSSDDVQAYGEGFMESFLEALRVFSTSSKVASHLLDAPPTADETRWHDALATVWLTLVPAGDAGSQPCFVVYQYCISLGIVTLKRSSGVKVILPGASRVLPGLPYTLLSLVAGWWGLPWGPIYTLESVFKNLGGGVDVTAAVQQAALVGAA